MRLYAVTITGVCPWQCVTVTDNKERAEKIVQYLKEKVGPEVKIMETDSLFPDDMTNADKAWLDAMEGFRP